MNGPTSHPHIHNMPNLIICNWCDQHFSRFQIRWIYVFFEEICVFVVANDVLCAREKIFHKEMFCFTVFRFSLCLQLLYFSQSTNVHRFFTLNTYSCCVTPHVSICVWNGTGNDHEWIELNGRIIVYAFSDAVKYINRSVIMCVDCVSVHMSNILINKKNRIHTVLCYWRI